MTEAESPPVRWRILCRKTFAPASPRSSGRICARKPLLKKAVVERLTNAGFARKKRPGGWPLDVVGFSHPDPSFEGYLIVGFAPGLRRQMDFGFRDWMRADLITHL